MTESWAKSQARKRNFLSFAICALLYAIALFAVWFVESRSIKDLSDASGPIRIKIGSPDGTEDSAFLSGTQIGQPSLAQAADESLPENPAEPPSPQPADDEKPSANTIAADSSPKPSSPSPSSSLKPSVTPKPSPSSKKTATPRPSVSPQPSAQTANASPKPAVNPTASSGAASGSGTGSNPNGKPGAAVTKGSEQGNSYETNFEEGTTVVGRGLYVPIYLYLPLPNRIDTAIFNGIKGSAEGFTTADNRRAEFKKYYKLGDGAWVLRDNVTYEERPRLWILLSESGYKVSGADYKASRNLRQVVLEFQVGAQKGDTVPLLESVKVLSSSGYSDIDDSVIYGFKEASFYNNSPRSVTGRFTYSFD